jgi:cbb3-type cytochrome oxidase maturation protein
MNILILLVPLALSLGMLFLVLFLRANHQGQFDDLDTPSIKILADDTIGRMQ